MFSMLLGQGVIGGRMNDPYEHGRAAAAMAGRVLAGTPADALHVVPSAQYLPRFDYVVLQRFHIAESALPPGSIVIGRPASFYAEHTRLVWTTGAVFLFLTLTIAWLTHLISRMRRAERELVSNQVELRRAQQFEMIGSLAGGIAHDFNNLITAIAGFNALAVEQAPPDDEVLHDHLDQVARASHRAATLTRQLLSYARRQPVEPRVVDLNTVVMEAHKLLRRLLNESVELVTLPAPEPAFVFADPGQLEQVLSNLATNARDAMPAGGKLTLTVSVTANEVLLQASDTGLGMSEEVKARIFEPFFTTKDVGCGAGLGLATSFAIIAQAGGSLDVQSSPGQKTTFTIRLPRRMSAPQESAEPTPTPQPSGVSWGLVLLAEDDPQVRRVAARALEGHGFEVLEAENGAIALELATQRVGRLSCVLTDVVMPIMGGHEFVRRLRLVDPTVPVVVMSGYVDDSSLFDEARQLDVRFIAKPFLPADLVLAVCECARATLRGMRASRH
jgi:signal transduction histidine kinase/CheY-like chemotaxis protein